MVVQRPYSKQQHQERIALGFHAPCGGGCEGCKPYDQYRPACGVAMVAGYGGGRGYMCFSKVDDTRTMSGHDWHGIQ